MTPTEPSARGSLRLRVTHAIDGLRLPWVDVRVEESRPAADSAPEPLAFTFRVDLGEDGRATRPLRLTPGRYRVRLAAGTGWATWSPPADDGWAEVTISDSPVETNVVLHYRATLLRISVAGESGGPIGMFNMMVHRLEPPARIAASRGTDDRFAFGRVRALVVGVWTSVPVAPSHAARSIRPARRTRPLLRQGHEGRLR